MKPAAFDYVLARNAEDAVQQLAAGGEEARVLAGGQSLVPMMNFRIARPAVLVDLGACGDLDYTRVEGDSLHIGAMTRQRVAQDSAVVREACPLVSAALALAGPATVRNRGTVGGSLANGYPVAHLPCVAVCLSARLRVLGPEGEREIAAEDFFIDAMVTDIAPGELLRESLWPAAQPGERCDVREIANHRGGGALCIVALRLRALPTPGAYAASVAVSGLAGVPWRLRALEDGLAQGMPVADWSAAIDADFARVDPAGDDAHVSYVADVARRLVLDGLRALAPELHP